MRIPSGQTVVVKPELIRLVRRDDSKKWQVHYKLENVKTWFRRSTDTANVKDAAKIAERMWMKGTFDHEEGRPVISKKFKPVAEVVLHRLEAEIAAGTAKPLTGNIFVYLKLRLSTMVRQSRHRWSIWRRRQQRCGMIVRRDPISDAELADLVNAVLLMDPAQSAMGSSSGTLIPQRKFNDMTLMRVSGISTNVLCECPRHVAEIIAQLASFEQYSHDCLNKSSEDAHIHAYLSSVSGSARALFESALEMVALHEGIDLARLSK